MLKEKLLLLPLAIGGAGRYIINEQKSARDNEFKNLRCLGRAVNSRLRILLDTDLKLLLPGAPKMLD